VILLDTNVVSEALKPAPARQVVDWLNVRFADCASRLVNSATELRNQPRRLENLQAIAHFSARLEVLSFSQKAAAHYGQIRTDLERKGRPVGACDMLTAAHARSEGLIVVTNDTREFERMPGVRVENWI
jgi:tRNA(fMet)-specific endonuclease VapC